MNWDEHLEVEYSNLGKASVPPSGIGSQMKRSVQNYVNIGY